jgi:D-glycero-alpha-D-manno-heptose-7-phosphate kinase
MIISKTPFRISFFGGGTDYPQWAQKHGGSVISATIDKFIYLSVKSRPSFFKSKYRIVYSKIDNAKKLSEIKHKVVRKAIQHYNIKNGLEVHYDADLPSRSGIGSSSSFTVGLLNAFDKFLNNKNTEYTLAKKSIFFEQEILKEVVGYQDQVAASYGGFNKILFKKNREFTVEKFKNEKTLKLLNDHLLLFHSGIYRTANDIATEYVKKLNKSQQMEKIYNMVDIAESHLKKGNVDSFGQLLDKAWQEKKMLDKIISNNAIDKIYDAAIQNGALGGKLLGAGGGGFMIFFVPIKKQQRLIKLFKNLIHIPFKFSNLGSKVLEI